MTYNSNRSGNYPDKGGGKKVSRAGDDVRSGSIRDKSTPTRIVAEPVKGIKGSSSPDVRIITKDGRLVIVQVRGGKK
jgi:hypothetical protein